MARRGAAASCGNRMLRLTGERARRRVLFSAPSPKTPLWYGRPFAPSNGCLKLAGGGGASRHTRGRVCSPGPTPGTVSTARRGTGARGNLPLPTGGGVR